MKVSIIAFNDLNKCPYANIYTELCKNNNVDYEIIFANRGGNQPKCDCNTKGITWDPSKEKLVNFLKFRSDVIKYLKKNPSDFIVVLTTMPAVLLGSFLTRRYKGRYIVDIRDYTYENISPYYAIEKSVIKNSAASVISSPGFKKFLPEFDYLICHNVNSEYRTGINRSFKPTSKERITIGYVGSIAYKEQCIKLMKFIENDTRFEFELYGNETGEDVVTQYVAQCPCSRIRMHGPYEPQEKVRIMSDIDILFNAYGNGRSLLNYALSNKLYDSFYMRLPLLTSPQTAMSEEASDYSFDLDFDTMTSLDPLYDWYFNIDGNSFDKYSEEYLKKVFAEQDYFYSQLCKVILK